MVSKNTIVGIVGAVILTGALAGIMYYENSTFEGTPYENPADAYAITWKEASGSMADETKTGADGTATAVTRAIEVRNLKSVTFELSWTDDESAMSGSDELVIKVTAPSGATATYTPGQSASGTSSPLTVTANLNEMPENVILEAESEADAKAKAGGDNGSGIWTIEVTVNVNSALPMLPIDTGNDWTLKTSYAYFDPVAEKGIKG
ncbi:MAG: hypothetical protein CVT48_00755 [Thermoplasmata archaeon HGW-Thermoplasmata-1]|nr:MAG: hypothetical protein CVT48_00755 [Thermoplasmata archaeon HGW-Thermoplasmata-1]